MNITDELTRQALVRPDAIAVALPNATLSYHQLEDFTWRAVAFLHQQGIRKRDVVAMFFSSELSLLIAILAVARLGGTAFTLPLGLPSVLRAELLEDTGAEFLLSDRPANDAERLPAIIMTFEHLARQASEVDISLRDSAPEAHCVIARGSGSTGKQKLIPYTHRQFLAVAARTARQYALSPGDRLATLVHLNFVSTQRRYLSLISAGATIVLFNRLQVNLVELVEQCKVSILIGTVYHMERVLSALPEGARSAMSRLRLLVVTSSAISTSLRNRIAERLTRNLGINYGANECSTMVWARAPEVFEIEGTVGSPMEGVAVEIIDAAGRPAPVGEVGQIRLQAPGMVDGYLNDEEATRKSFRDGWFYPGDLGKFTRQGQLIYCGRADHMMIMNGVNIYPAEIERVVVAHRAVREAVAVPVKHPVHQDVPVCAVSVHDGESVAQDELMDYAHLRLGAHGPVFIVLLDEIPRDERGKLLRPALYRQLREKLPFRDSGG